MPRSFTAADRAAIRDALLAAGETSFRRYGIRKTSVEELAAAAGIAKGTFYRFFASKEDLCMAILERLEDARREELSALLEAAEGPAEALETVLGYGLDLVGSDALLAVLRETGELRQVVRAVGRERWSRHLERDRAFVEALVAILRRLGARQALDPDIVAGVLRAVVSLGFHADEIGSEVFPAVRERIVRWVARGMVGA